MNYKEIKIRNRNIECGVVKEIVWPGTEVIIESGEDYIIRNTRDYVDELWFVYDVAQRKCVFHSERWIKVSHPGQETYYVIPFNYGLLDLSKSEIYPDYMVVSEPFTFDVVGILVGETDKLKLLPL